MRRLSGRGPVLGYSPGKLVPDLIVAGAVRLRKPGFDSGEPFLAQSRLGFGYAQLRMRCGESDRDGPAAGDLLAKLGDDAARAAEDVSESDYDEARAAGALDLPAYLLGQALRGAHDVGRVHRLVGRHQYEFFAAVIARGARQ